MSTAGTPGNPLFELERVRSVGVIVLGLLVSIEARTCLPVCGCWGLSLVPASHMSEARPSGSVDRREIEAADDSLVLGCDGEPLGRVFVMSLEDRTAGLRAVSEVDAGPTGVGDVLRRRVSSDALR